MTAWFMAGNGGNRIATFREQKLVVAVTRQAYKTRDMRQQTFAMIDRILASAACREQE